MDNETRQHIQKIENLLSRALDDIRKLKDITGKQDIEINELKTQNRALETEIQILKDGGNI